MRMLLIAGLLAFPACTTPTGPDDRELNDVIPCTWVPVSPGVARCIPSDP